MLITGSDAEEAVRIVELPPHRFCVVTLYLAQVTSTPAAPEPLIVGFLQAALSS